jgi:hypothetical protein
MSLVIYCADFSRVHKKFKYDVPICLALGQTGGYIYAVAEHLSWSCAQIKSVAQDAAGGGRVLCGVEHYKYLLAEAAFGPLFPHRQGTERHGSGALLDVTKRELCVSHTIGLISTAAALPTIERDKPPRLASAYSNKK